MLRHLFVLSILLLLTERLDAQQRRVIGLSESGKEIEAFLVGETAGAGSAPQVWVGGLDGVPSDTVVNALQSALDGGNPEPAIFIPLANPDQEPLQFPPEGAAYREKPAAHFLWNWIALQGPRAIHFEEEIAVGEIIGPQPELFSSFFPGASLNSAEVLASRRARSPEQLAEELDAVYGHDFDQLTYLPGMALIGQMRMGNVEEVSRLAEPYLDPQRDLLARASSLTLAGHLVFAELAERLPEGESRDQYIELVRRVAELGFDENGVMHESMPFHGEMSDSYFMAGPIVTKAGKFTGETRYFDMVVQHFRYLQTLTLREDGLHRHSPLTDSAWGRGNAFPALGLALTLTDFPEDHPGYSFILESFQNHMAALARYQDPDGMWHNVIDVEGSFAETSATSMIAVAMLRGIRNGWLDASEYQPRVDRAWNAVLARISSNGELIDVCESTNKQPSLEAYMDREALLGTDPRGGAMALLLATEMAGMN